MVLNIPDAKLLKEAFSNWLDTGENKQWNEDGTHTNAEYQKLLDRLTHVADGKPYSVRDIDATAWQDNENERSILFMYEDGEDQTLRIDLCDSIDEFVDAEEHVCEVIRSFTIDMITGELY